MARPYEAILDLDPPAGSQQDQLEFQNFVLSDDTGNTARSAPSPQKQSMGNMGANQNPFANNSAPFGQPLPQFQQPQPMDLNGNNQQQQPQQSRGPFWTIEYYSPYFDVNSDEVFQRMLWSILPKHKFTDLVGEKADLYGPIWISTTVIFCLFISSSVAESIKALMQDEDYTYDMTLFTFAVGLVYIYALAVPFLLWGILRYFRTAGLGLLQIIDLYGYGLTIWIPVSLLCVLPSEIVRWILVLGAFVVSAGFHLRTLGPAAKEAQDARAATAVLVLTIVFQAGLSLLFKFVFFKHVVSVTAAFATTTAATSSTAAIPAVSSLTSTGLNLTAAPSMAVLS